MWKRGVCGEKLPPSGDHQRQDDSTRLNEHSDWTHTAGRLAMATRKVTLSGGMQVRQECRITRGIVM